MVSPDPDCWITDPPYIALLNYLIKETESVKSPMNILPLIRDFRKKSGSALTVNGLMDRIMRVRARIHSFKHIFKKSKVKLMFALSAPIDAGFLNQLREDASVEVDGMNRITHYKANDGSLELNGDHSISAKMRSARRECKHSHRKMIINYFKTKDDADAVPKNKEEKEMKNLIEFITGKCENVNSPLRINQLAEDFIQHFRIARSSLTIRNRLISYCREIQKAEFLDTGSKVKQLFVLSATVDSDCLEKLRKDASVEVDGKNRITSYKAKDGSLVLRGDHSRSAKLKTVQYEDRKFIRNYYINKNNTDAVPENEAEKEMWNFIEFITEKCENVNSPLNISQSAKDFNMRFGIGRPLNCIFYRVRGYCREIQKTEFMSTHSKVKQLFCLRAKLNLEDIEKLRKTAIVKVDHKNRIIEYTSNDNSLTLRGGHCGSKKESSRRLEKTDKNNVAAMSENSEEESDQEGLDSSRYELSSKEFDSEFDSDDENDLLDETGDFMEQSKGTNDFNNEAPVRSRSDISIYKNFDFHLPTKRSHRPEEIKTRETVEEGTNPALTENAVTKTRSGRLSKRRHLDSNFSYDLANSVSLGGLMSSSSSYSKPAKHFHPPTERSHVSKVIEMREDDGKKRKKINNYTPGSSSSNWTGESSNNSMRPNEMDDYDTNYSIDDQVKLEPFRGSIQEDLNDFKEDEEIQQIPKPLHAHDEHNQIEEVPIKEEPEEPKIVENPQEDVKPEIAQAHDEHKELIEFPIELEHEEPIEVKPEKSHNSKVMFFEALQSLILCLDTPCLSGIESIIHQKIQKLGGQDEVMLNDEIVLIIELLISRMTNTSVANLSENVESVNFSNLLCYLKAAILNSKMSGMEGLVQNINELIEESHNKRIPMEKVANSLLVTLDIDEF